MRMGDAEAVEHMQRLHAAINTACNWLYPVLPPGYEVNIILVAPARPDATVIIGQSGPEKIKVGVEHVIAKGAIILGPDGERVQ